MWEEYLHLVSDPAHLMLEVTMIIVVDVIIGMIAWPLIKKAIRKHDREHH